MVEETMEKVKLIQERMKAAQDRQKSYVDSRRKELEFEVGEKVLLKVSPTKGGNAIWEKRKIESYIGLYEILESWRSRI